MLVLVFALGPAYMIAVAIVCTVLDRKRRAHRGNQPLTPDQEDRLAITRAFLGDPNYMPHRPEDR